MGIALAWSAAPTLDLREFFEVEILEVSPQPRRGEFSQVEPEEGELVAMVSDRTDQAQRRRSHDLARPIHVDLDCSWLEADARSQELLSATHQMNVAVVGLAADAIEDLGHAVGRSPAPGVPRIASWTEGHGPPGHQTVMQKLTSLRCIGPLALLAGLAPAAALAQEAPSAPAACGFSEVFSASEFDTTERGAFTSDGRFFFIGTRVPRTSFLVEVTKSGDRHAATNYVTGSLEGTSDGTLRGSPKGDACMFTGMTVHGHVLYAGCMTFDGRASLHQIDTRAGTVRTGAFTSCNFEPAREPCKPVPVFPNGMAVDGAGRLYFSDMTTHLAVHPERVYSIGQVEVDPAPDAAGQLRFRHRTWLAKDLMADGIAPNGIQIEGDVLYYVGGANLNAVPIRADGTAGERQVAYRGPLLSYIDDFALDDGEIALARTLPSALVRLERPLDEGAERSVVTCSLPPLAPPSSITYQPDLGPRSLFPVGALVVTSFFGGGLYTLPFRP